MMQDIVLAAQQQETFGAFMVSLAIALAAALWVGIGLELKRSKQEDKKRSLLHQHKENAR